LGKGFFDLEPDSYNFTPRLFMVKTTSVTAPIHCRNCENPACKAACVPNAISMADGRVIVDPKRCIGCKSCVSACPFGAIELVETGQLQFDGTPSRVALKCDLCSGVADSPSCVKVCLTDALELVTEDDLQAELVDKRRTAVMSSLTP
jgi:electron transport protein HydN